MFRLDKFTRNTLAAGGLALIFIGLLAWSASAKTGTSRADRSAELSAQNARALEMFKEHKRIADATLESLQLISAEQDRRAKLTQAQRAGLPRLPTVADVMRAQSLSYAAGAELRRRAKLKREKAGE